MKLGKKKLISILVVAMFLLVGVLGASKVVYASTYDDCLSNCDQYYNEEKCKEICDPKNAVGADEEDDSRSTGTSADGNSTMSNILAWILYHFATGLSALVSVFIGAMVYVANYNEFVGMPIVEYGWEMVRDIANNFFIIILLVIAVGTILRVPNYNRQLLPKLLLMAVLINFSKMITGILIDFSQLLTLFFAGKIQKISKDGAIILYALGLHHLYDIKANATKWTDPIPGATNLNGQNVIVAMLYALILSVVALVVVAMITIILVYRVVMLWFLIILSPLAFMLSTFPRGQQYYGRWWSELVKYLIVAPVMLFFLYLGFFSGSVDVKNPSSGQEAPNVTISEQTDITSYGITTMEKKESLFSFLIIIGLMVGALVMAQETGVAGAKWAGKGLGALQKWGKAAPGYVANKVDQKAGLSQKAYNAGLGRVPLVSTALGKRIGGLSAETARVEKVKIDAASAAMSKDLTTDQMVKGMSGAGIGGGSIHQRIAYAQKLAQQGYFKDDPNMSDADKAQRAGLITKARADLSSNPELKGVFDDNIRKYSQSLALQSSMYTKSDGTLDKSKVESDLTTGKLDATKMMGSISDTTLTALKAMTGGKDDSIMKFLLNNTDEKSFAATMKAMNKTQRDEISKDIDFNTFKDSTGKYDNKLREKYLEGNDYRGITKVFDDTDTAEKAEHDKYVTKNKKEISAKVGLAEMDDFVEQSGHIIEEKDIEAISSKGEEFKKGIQDAMTKAVDAVVAAGVTATNSDQAKKLQRNALLSGAKLNNFDNTTLNEMLNGASAGDKKKIVERMNSGNINSSFVASTAESLRGKDWENASVANKNTLKTTLTSTISSSGRTPAEQKELMINAMDVGAEINTANSAEKGIFKNDIVPKINLKNLQNGKFIAKDQLDNISMGADVGVLKSFLLDPGKNVATSQEIKKRLRGLPPSNPRAIALKDFLT